MTDHPGFPPNYWEMLSKAGSLMDKVDACTSCLSLWRSHGPGHYLAIRNISACGECAARTAEPVERAVLDWQYEHDPLKSAVKRVVEEYRAFQKTLKGKTYQEWEQGRGTPESLFDALAELDRIIPKEGKEEPQ